MISIYIPNNCCEFILPSIKLVARGDTMEIIDIECVLLSFLSENFVSMHKMADFEGHS